MRELTEALQRTIYDGAGGVPVRLTVAEWKSIARFMERAEWVKAALVDLTEAAETALWAYTEADLKAAPSMEALKAVTRKARAALAEEGG